eukprot:TRINITY_DN1192_c0_g1_i5.p1 TRINITY_DN1192_c0_g1~~TRINITY_DN1192_c0_g1_i5.p1  ORF type:complete len:967 (-),score=113.08 TRINITY_DN1192_c0_g1_i5:314-3214(-)
MDFLQSSLVLNFIIQCENQLPKDNILILQFFFLAFEMNFGFSALLGAPYRGGNAVLRDKVLLCPAGNRINQLDLTQSCGSTLPFENSKQIQTLCLSPDGVILMSIDLEGKSLIINMKSGALLHHFSFKEPVRVARFSPDGKYIAVAVGNMVQIWQRPQLKKEFSPMHLHRRLFKGLGSVTALDWSLDGQWIAASSKDFTTRVCPLEVIPRFRMPVLGGHRDTPIGLFFISEDTKKAAKFAELDPPEFYVIDRNGAVHCWGFEANEQQLQIPDDQEEHQQEIQDQEDGQDDKGQESDDDKAMIQVSEADESSDDEIEQFEETDEDEDTDQEQERRLKEQKYANGRWSLRKKFFLEMKAGKVSAADYHRDTGVLAIGYERGVFELVQMPEFTVIQTLSVSRQRITTLSFSNTGDWLALGCAQLGQLLVWEWRSEAYILKQQGHFYDVTSVAFSPDGGLLATAADDAKLKIWNLQSNFCFVTFSDHKGPVTAVRFIAPSGNAVVSASLDGTVRAFDLVRYRNFRTMTTPQPIQFSCLAVDEGGEVICAGSKDTFQICVWSLRTGKLLDQLAAHEAPISGLEFCPGQAVLASSSWDKTVKIWDIFQGRGTLESLHHNHDVLAIAFRPDGKQLAAATLAGQICLWNPEDAILLGTIEGRRDIVGGRLTNDRRVASHLQGGRCFTSIAYSADGAWIIAGGKSKWVCIYDTREFILLRKFQISNNKSLDGVLDMLNSKNLTDAGPLSMLEENADDDKDVELLPPTLAGGQQAKSGLPGTGMQLKPAIQVRQLALSPTGQCWAAACTEGVLLYSKDTSMSFDPTYLEEDITESAVYKCLNKEQYLRALLISLRLNEREIISHVVLSTPFHYIDAIIEQLPEVWASKLFGELAMILENTPHLEFMLVWLNSLLQRHGSKLKKSNYIPLPVFRQLSQTLKRMHSQLKDSAEDVIYKLKYLISVGDMQKVGMQMETS